ncbi:DUF1080 domain-containing protein [candidate division KSB1 bacterium]|nr:DUF1080 domain-containing protein [candidate division KSB1 bacterium]
MRIILRGFTIIFFSLILYSCTANRSELTSTSATKGFTIEKLISRLPARDDFEREYLFGSIIRFGSAGIQQICLKLDTEDDTQAQLALNGLATYVTRPNAENERKLFTKGIGVALKSSSNFNISAFLIRQLQFAGGDESVELLAKYLTDNRLCEPATRALLSIGTPKAEKGFIKTLSKINASNRITIIKALGEFRSQSAVSQIREYANSNNRDLKMASLYALANIGDSASKDILDKNLSESSGFEKAKINSLFLLFAQRLAENGHKDMSVEICRQLMQRENTETNIQTAALGTLVDVLGEAAQPDLLSAVDSNQKALQIGAIDLANKIKGPNQTAQWVEIIDQVRPDISARILQMLGERGDISALPSIQKAMRSDNQIIQIAAIQSAVKLGGSSAIPGLLNTFKRSQDSEIIQTIQDQLLYLPGTEIVRLAVETLPGSTPKVKIAILEFLAARNARNYSELVFRQISQSEPEVQIAAIKALESLASAQDLPRLIDVLLTSENNVLQSTLQKTIAALVKKSPDSQEQQSYLLTKLEGASADQKKHLLPVIGRIGGESAVSVVAGETQNMDPGIKDAAIRALADWPDESAIDPLFKIASSEDSLTYHVLALRACARIAGVSDLSAEKKIDIYNKILATAKRPDEKKLALAGLAEIKQTESLRTLTSYLANNDLSLEASLAAINVSSEYHPENGELGGSEIAMAFIEEMVEPDIHFQLKKIIEQDNLNRPPKGFTSLFNGIDLSGWKGLVENPVKRAKMSREELARTQVKADSIMNVHWRVEDGILLFDGEGFNHLCTRKDYGDFEMLVDWKIEKNGDSGLYLRGSPQVQIWDPEQWQVGSGGLYNNQKGPSKPSVIADMPIGEWNTFRIKMIGDRVTIHLNDLLVVDNVVLENYWERDKPIYATGQIELQTHDSPVYFRNIYIREIPRQEPLFEGDLFNGKDLSGWQPIGSPEGSWQVEDGVLFTDGKGGGWLSTTQEFANFKLELEFRVPDGGNSGVFLRAPHEGDPAYTGMEVQVLDDYAEKYAKLRPWQYTGSVYAVQAPSSRASKKANEWQKMIIICNGPKVTVVLNDIEIINTNLIDHLEKARTNPGIKRRKGYIGLQNHSTKIEYRNIRLQELELVTSDN